MGTWGLAQAKAHLSEIVHQAESKGPQVITRSGRNVAVLISMDEWNKAKEAAKPKEGLGDFLMNSPLSGSGLDIRRARGKARVVEF
jgi:prevent-host-death family protein